MESFMKDSPNILWHKLKGPLFVLTIGQKDFDQ